MLNQLFARINLKRLSYAIGAVFVFFFVYGFLVHGVLMEEPYKSTAHLWRSEEEMVSYLGWLWFGKLLLAASFCTIYARGYEGTGMMEGVRFGLLMAPFAIASKFIYYAVMPLPSPILWSWVIYGFIEVVLAGVIAGLVYRRE